MIAQETQELPERTQPHQAPIRAQVDVTDPRKEESISTMERGVPPLCQAGQRPRRPTVWLLPGPGAAEQGFMHGVCDGIFARSRLALCEWSWCTCMVFALVDL